MAEPTQHTPMTKERLARYVSLRMETENQLERLARLRNDELLPAPKISDGSQRTGGASGRMANAVLKRMEFEERITPLIEANRQEMARIEAAIDRIADPMEREVLRLRYIDGSHWRHLPWGEVALRIDGDNDERCLLAAYRLHKRALNSIQKMGR